MATLLFKLQNVPDDEAADVRDLLAEHDVYFYETHAGFWRLGVDGLWLPDDSNLERAQALIRAYQEERTSAQKKVYAELVEQGQAPTLWQNFLLSPLRFVLLILAVFFVLTLTLAPFGFMGTR
ncbi:MAG: hypothetical protein EOO52_18205 [Gammaproteobacteria bacterium]|nr:MAG: hypothetical protein EOO52_18205 [Gammaproteobacteria bacterium]